MKKSSILLFVGIFIFIASIEGIKTSWGLMGGGAQKQLLSMIEGGTIPIVGLAIGLLATSLVQSSSAVVAATMASLAGMVASGMPMTSAISFGVPIVLGANVGTTVTNSLVALGHSRDGKEFDSAVPGAIVHDIFNILNVTLFFLLEMTTGFLSKSAVFLSNQIISLFNLGPGNTKPVHFLSILIEKPIITPISGFLNNNFGGLFGSIFLLVGSFTSLVLALLLISKNVRHLLDTTTLKDKIFKTLSSPFRSALTGTSVTWTLQSSSIATSLALPFLATEAIDLEQMYSYTLGCNIGTTIDLSQLYGYMASGIAGVSLGLTHIMINTLGVIFWLFTPLKKIPPKIAKEIGGRITSNKIAPAILIAYVGVIFFGIPTAVIFLL